MKRLLTLTFVFLMLCVSTPGQLGSPASRFRRAASDQNCTMTGQVYFNTTTSKVRVCTATGTPGTWVDQVSNGGSFTFAPFVGHFATYSAIAQILSRNTDTSITPSHRFGSFSEVTLTPSGTPTVYNAYGVAGMVTIPPGQSFLTSGGSEFYGGYFSASNSSNGDKNSRLYGIYSDAFDDRTSGSIYGVIGGQINANIYGLAPRFGSIGLSATMNDASTGNHPASPTYNNSLVGIGTGVTHNGVGAYAEIVGLNIKNSGGGAILNGAGAVPNMYSIRISQPSTNYGTQVGTNYGIDLADHSTVGVINYNLYSRGVNSKNVFEGKIYGADGTAAAPSIAFTADSDTGFYRAGSNEFGLAIGGVKRFSFDAGGFASGRFNLFGATSGSVSLSVGGTITSYEMFFPGAQGSGYLSNDGSGQLSWTTPATYIGGSGSSGFVPRFTGSDGIEDSPIRAENGDIQIDSVAGTTRIGDVNSNGSRTTIILEDKNRTIKLDTRNSGSVSLGDVDGNGESTKIVIDDSTQVIELHASQGTKLSSEEPGVLILDANQIITSLDFYKTGTPSISGAGSALVGSSRDSAGKFTVTTTGAATVTLTFSASFAVAPACNVTNETTSNLVRATSTTTNVIFNGVTTNGDTLAYICVGY